MIGDTPTRHCYATSGTGLRCVCISASGGSEPAARLRLGPCGRRKDLNEHGNPGIPVHRHRGVRPLCSPASGVVVLLHGARRPPPHHPQQPRVIRRRRTRHPRATPSSPSSSSPSACVAAALEMQRETRRPRPGPVASSCGSAWASTPAKRPRRPPAWSGSRYIGRPGSPPSATGARSLVSSSTMALVQDSLPVGATLLDLGPHRLKDLGRPEVIFQLTGSTASTSKFPPLRSLDGADMPSNLPVPLTSFVGRDAEVEARRPALRDAQTSHASLEPVGSARPASPYMSQQNCFRESPRWRVVR